MLLLYRIIIFVVFSITGLTATWISRPILDFIGINQAAISFWVYWPLRIIIIEKDIKHCKM